MIVHLWSYPKNIKKKNESFSNLKKAISSNDVLRYNDSTKALVFQVDASQR